MNPKVLKTILFVMLAFSMPLSVWGQEVDSLMMVFKNNSHINSGNEDIAIETGELILSIHPEIVTDSASIDFILALAKCYDSKKRYDKSIELNETVIEILNTKGDNNFEIANILIEIGKQELKLHQYEKAESTFLQVEEMCKELYGEDTQEFADILDEIGRQYWLTDYNDVDKENNKSVNYFSRAQKIYIETKGYYSLDVAERLERIALAYKGQGEYNNAIGCYKEAKEIYKKLKGHDCLEIAKIINSIILIYCQFELEDEAFLNECFNELKEININAINADDDKVASLLSKIGNCYGYINDYENAISYLIQAKDVYYGIILKDKIPNSINEMFYFAHIYEIGDLYNKIYGYDRVISFYVQEQERFISLEGDYYALLASEISAYIANCYYKQGDYNKALYFYIKRKEEHKDFRYSSIGNNSHLGYIFERIGNCYEKMHDSDNAIDYYSQAIRLFNYNKFDKYDKDDYGVGRMLEDIGDCYLFLNKEYNKAIQQYCTAIQQYNNKSSDILLKLGTCYYYLKEYSQALDCCFQSYDIYMTSERNYIEQETDILTMISHVYFDVKDYNRAYSYINEALEINYNDLIDWLFRAREFYRIKYWNSISKLFLSDYPSIVFSIKEKIPTGNLYNKSALFAKGLLLTTDKEISHFIFESGDSILISTYNSLQNIQKQLIKLNELHSDNSIITLYEKKAEILEDKMLVRLNKLKEFKEYKQNMQLTWRDVQKKLSDNDIAIEFLSFPKFGTDNIMYIALTVRPGYDQPHLIEICNESDLKDLKESAYTSTAVSKLIWGKLADEGELNGVDTIYFSPSGLLHTIAIESLPHWAEKDSLMCNKYKIYRLSSTRELAIKRNTIGTNKALLYGGMKYSCPPKDMVAETNELLTHNDLLEYVASNDIGIGERLAEPVASMLLGEEWNDLPPTMVKSIKGMLDPKYDVALICDKKATETSFKLLSKKNEIIVLHTHGFYWDKSKALEETSARKANHERILPFMQIDDAMTRCGLAFNGANNIKKGVTIQSGYDDGILTAQEVANLDLRGLDLLVLSACQTGDGEIGSDGVFGLQRGFKKAGTQSIIMSLWEVDSQATEMMMKEFFKAWTGDCSKHEAFVKAQNEVKKEYGNKYDEEKHKGPHWAAFILLDAIDR